jgi:hypothetical protein
MVCPLGVRLAVPAVATIEVDEDVDGGPHGRCCQEFRQRPPPKLMKTSMASPWEVLSGAPASATTGVDEDVDGGPLGGAVGSSGSSHH